MKKIRGFTLVELMVTVAIVGILSAVAIPSYQDYVRRSELTPAISTLSDLRVRMEQYYQDNRNYGTAGGACGVAAPASTASNKFTYTCALQNTDQGFLWMATGNSGTNVEGFIFRINHQNVQSTTGVHTSWGSVPASGTTSWVTRKGG